MSSNDDPGAGPKYARIERERRFLVAAVPDGVVERRTITDRYLHDTHLRLRQVVGDDGVVVRKLTHKVRLAGSVRQIACTSVPLDDVEWALLSALPGDDLAKTRHVVVRDGVRVVVDELADGTLLAEIDDGDEEPVEPPAWLGVQVEVTDDEAWTGASLATRQNVADK
ncbi:hypothetical protein KUV85_05240 [Nocardioides panacisoli]|uniref:hypothetical protein n=1 Tax=Nocardioides panacisoli TaxID=627624 RepID=UPI001C62FBA7|nr:hypothetical protein [Nocardioides panacisoli]QYJ05092.1 hypothetical protein KUV85_05240 [Nocardioides panacisoli]